MAVLLRSGGRLFKDVVQFKLNESGWKLICLLAVEKMRLITQDILFGYGPELSLFCQFFLTALPCLMFCRFYNNI